MPLDPKDRDRLEKLLNMLGSPVDGEIANAGRMIQKMATRYNVTPADLCLNNRIGSAAPEHDHAARWGASPFTTSGRRQEQRGPDGRTWDDIFAERDRRERERQEERARRQQEQRDREREEERQRRQEEARRRAARQPKVLPGRFFGLLARLKAIYESQFDDLDEWKRDFIEDVLGRLVADRQMTIREREMAKAIIKFTEEAEPLV
jgi:hypothetical protein